MVIIKHGQFAKVIGCSCGCEFEYDERDVERVEDENSTTPTLVVTCPECGTQHTIPSN